jgi:DnaJ-class molecular chaperone
MNRDPRGYYAALGVAPDATAAQIQRAFRALMRLNHPDVEISPGQGNVNDGEEARRVLEAYAVLRNPRSRAAYDPGAAGPGPGGAVPGGREISVRLHRSPQPLFRATPVRWERGPT